MPARDNRWQDRRLRDRIPARPRALFVGINPGVRSAETGHHFAGYSNRFWKLLHESGLVPEPLTYLDDDRLGEWGFGITNVIARPTPGMNDLHRDEYVEGWTRLERKIARYRPAVVALVGVTVYRAILPLIGVAARPAPDEPSVGLKPLTIRGARVYVLPNPSGRNANFSHAEMLAAFRGLARTLGKDQRQSR